MTFRQIDALLRDNGWIPDKKGNGSSHLMYRKNSKKVPVPDHPGDIPKGTLESIKRQAGLK